MPRKQVELPYKVELLSILDEHGQVDKELEPNLSAIDLKNIYRYMLLARRADERMLLLQRQGRLGTFPQSSGHEAIALGAAFAIQATDWMVPAYRELAAMLYRGWPLETILLYWNGFEEGAKVPDGVNDLPYCVPIASQLPHAVGIGMAMNIANDKKVVLAFFGDGAASEGDCHEALNFASVFSAPVIFVCLNNQYAISVPIARQMKAETIAQRAIGYGIPGIRVDGNDVLGMYVATKEAVDRARKGGGPSLIEGLTYRLTPHTTADDPKRYRAEEEVMVWKNREPLDRFKKYLINKGILNTEMIDSLEAEIESSIKSSVISAEELANSEQYNDPAMIFNYLYQDLPQHLLLQRQELQKNLKAQHEK